MQRGHCGNWVTGFAYTYAISNALIFVAYMAMPLALMRFRFTWENVVRAEHLRKKFALFILSCGIGHLEGIISFAWPAYHLFAVWNALTAAISWWTVFGLVAERDGWVNADG